MKSGVSVCIQRTLNVLAIQIIDVFHSSQYIVSSQLILFIAGFHALITNGQTS